MSLTDTFEKTIEQAAQRQKLGMDAFPSLHRMIVGPPRSGKTVMAREYAEILAEEGIIADKPAIRLDGSRLDNAQNLMDAAAQAKGGVLIIDEIDHVRTPDAIGRALVELLDKGECVIVMTGYADTTEKFMREHAARAQTLFTLTKNERSFTKSECTEYDMTSPAERKAARMRARQKKKEREERLAKERLLENLADVTLRRDIKPMRRLNIMKKGLPP